MTDSRKRRNAWRRGRIAETLGMVWLVVRGYRIMEKRMRTPVGEIDIVARRGRTLAIIEVKARADRNMALAAVGPRQRRRLQRAAAWLVAGRNDLATLDIRFDVLAVTPWRVPLHVTDAWRTEKC